MFPLTVMNKHALSKPAESPAFWEVLMEVLLHNCTYILSEILLFFFHKILACPRIVSVDSLQSKEILRHNNSG